MIRRRFSLTVTRHRQGPDTSAPLALSEVARLTGLHPDFVDKLVALGLIDPVETAPELLFEAAAVFRVRRIMRLRHDLGVNWAGIGIVLDLLERAEDLEQKLERLKAKKGRGWP